MTQSEGGASQLAGAVSQNGRALCNEEWARPYNPFVLPRVPGAVMASRSGKAASLWAGLWFRGASGFRGGPWRAHLSSLAEVALQQRQVRTICDGQPSVQPTSLQPAKQESRQDLSYV